MSKFDLERVPDVTPPRIRGQDLQAAQSHRQLADSIRVIQRNFQKVERELLRGVLNGDLVPPAGLALEGDVTGSTGASTVEKIRGKPVPTPGAPEDNKLMRYDDGADALIWTSILALLELVGDTQGQVFFRGAAAWEPLAPSTPGDVLTTQGPEADPTWETPSAGGSSASYVSTGSIGWVWVGGFPLEIA